MATLFGYFDAWKFTVLECPKCGWTGTFEQGSVEYFEELMDSSCPRCSWPDDPMLAIVSFPTIQDYHDNWDKLSDEEKKYVEHIENLRKGS